MACWSEQLREKKKRKSRAYRYTRHATEKDKTCQVSRKLELIVVDTGIEVVSETIKPEHGLGETVLVLISERTWDLKELGCSKTIWVTPSSENVQ